ncbi:DUF4386 family protein [Nonomuraea roseoviolacea]|uniref:DUF4386 family protein n=1 Tax=Nonomuraea roseoviolacea subsp. carminata TaxID=160689 RepID=A0ABT1JVY8_9ACTN|nr:DUF4386 family protein [Nonomuraea roseoviolacea]MCP2345745.1 hypothetical protein [Nonomuraea roseoviolacea subsp. carminata]
MRWTLAAGVLAANVAFVGLGLTFGYPDVLSRPPAEILAAFAAHQPAISAWFVLLALGAGTLVPAAVLLGRRLPDGPAAALSVHAGVLAGVVQVLGLLRWPFAVPSLTRAADPRAAETVFAALHAYLGTGVGETLGYLLTAAWTVLVLAALPRPPRWFAALGGASALAVAAGVLAPLGVPGADLANFAGYVAWSVWALCLAVLADRLTGPARALRRDTGAVAADAG